MVAAKERWALSPEGGGALACRPEFPLAALFQPWHLSPSMYPRQSGGFETNAQVIQE